MKWSVTPERISPIYCTSQEAESTCMPPPSTGIIQKRVIRSLPVNQLKMRRRSTTSHFLSCWFGLSLPFRESWCVNRLEFLRWCFVCKESQYLCLFTLLRDHALCRFCLERRVLERQSYLLTTTTYARPLGSRK